MTACSIRTVTCRLRPERRVQSAKNRNNSVFLQSIWSIKRTFWTQIPARTSTPQDQKVAAEVPDVDESVQLLQSVDGQNRERDYCILTIFLNCGLRISELCGLDLQDIQDDALRVLGKGNKVRIVYLNDACKDALKRYLAVRRPISAATTMPSFSRRATSASAARASTRSSKAPERRGARRFRILLAQAAPHGGNAHAAKWRGRQSRAGGARS